MRKNGDSVLITVKNAQDIPIRSFKVKADTGFNRIYWNYSTKGYRAPGSAKPKKDTPEPANGLPAEPGDYKVVVSLVKDSAKADSTTITVVYDPRSKFPAEIFAAQKTMVERINRSSEKLAAALDVLTDDEESIKKMENQLKDVEGARADSLRKLGKIMQDSIKNIRDFISGKKREKQGYGSLYQLTAISQLDDARGLVMDKTAMPGQQEERSIAFAEGLVQQCVNRVNNFNNGAWLQYRKLAEAEPAHIFKEPVKL
jgi:hypothetical protein